MAADGQRTDVLDAFNNSDFTLNSSFQKLLRGPVFRTLNGGDGLLHTIEFDYDHPLFQPAFIGFRSHRASNEATATLLNWGTRQLRVLRESGRILNRTVERYPITFSHYGISEKRLFRGSKLPHRVDEGV